MIMDELNPPKEPVMVVVPACVATRPLFMEDQDGADVKSATPVLLEVNDTRL
jgi:hypothetical protein